ncbi:hypothetical protein KFE25_014076 [Diacronema lutheri]|uniref:3-beta hydroxysteroid dehydrogenase/isomerase domain-containing protein n=2 Tax=Diacronema lutheri TaxID=2081491 RepID=A0A8J5X6Z8_DIALT|nr:hypothetical protein KFE25_014076 [Diacronema lutheri]
MATRTPSPDADPSKRPGLTEMVSKRAPRTGKKYVVLGTGNVGLTLVEALIARGETDVVGFDIVAPRRAPAKHFTFVCGDVAKYDDVRAALAGADVAFATFALIRYQERLAHDYPVSHAVNVVGTEHVIRACVEQSVPLLVQTSTSNVVLTAAQYGREDLDEAEPYCTAKTSPNHYGWTKAQAEQLVLAANGKPLASGKGVLTTVALRPCSGIFGPSDGMIAEGTLRNLHTKGSEAVVGTGRMDWLFCEDLVYAELLAERKMADEPSAIGGQALCVCADAPLPGYDFNLALQFYYDKLTGKKTTLTIAPIWLLYTIAFFVELYARLTHRKVPGDLAKLTPCMLDAATSSYACNGAKARRVLGFEPLYTFDEAAHRTVSLWLERQGGAE